ncbi:MULTISPECIES: LPS-assembly protein LptD [unclassified Francisella]|uniref:LPS-assembly protein LptD n=1 Tax=unclassified Francisella TaxID=2610885 RepID=UPI002E31B7E6|nr:MULTISPECIES: LPS assembly protein LptD [unclassified Francisella]MED7820371.1 LPS assembly protein LptD [Francisella sp. 19S2-4]MED7831206.1 LPS assembly protein LptD [Francisella sp. 19S2-10]
MSKKKYVYLSLYFYFLIFTIRLYGVPIVSNNPMKEDWECLVSHGHWLCHRAKKPKNVFSKKITSEQRRKALAIDLEWVNEPSYFVGGYYYDSDSQFTKALCRSKDTQVSYDNAQFDSDGTLIASGNVMALQCDQELYGDNAIIHYDEDDKSVTSIVAVGDVILKQPSAGVLIRTRDIDDDLINNLYSAGESYFRIYKKTPERRIYRREKYSNYIRGYATSLIKNPKGDLIIRDGYITTGSPYDNDWKISGRYINIDTKKQMLYMRDGFFKIKDIPIIYVPYISEPLNNKRRSGFLTPGFVQNDNAGYGVSIPYYFNLAPNYDLLLESVLWSKSGIMENGTFRYINKYSQSQLEGSIVPYDLQTGKIRGALTLSSRADFKNGITSNLAYDYVSDSQYYNDFSAGNINLVTKTLLDREFDLGYTNDYVNTALTLLKYGVVNPELTVSNTPYAKLPEFKLNLDSGAYLSDYMNLSLDTLDTFFYKQKGPASVGSETLGTNVNALRIYVAPKIAGNFTETWGYLKPSLQLPVRFYQLNNRPTDTIQFSKNSVTSILPIFNIDAGLYFDRDDTTENGTYTTTLHPRLFYTYIPYQNQNDIPLFDTSFQNLQYMQMFQVNRFTGYDRINNANQLTYALESNTVKQSDGTTLFSAKIGQMAYFADRKVTLCQGNSSCTVQDPFYKDNFSPVITSFQYQVAKNIYLSAQVNYRIEEKNFDYQVYQISYKDDNENIFNLSYNNIASDWDALTQQQIDDGDKPQAQQTITLSSIINLTDTWAIAALWNYDLVQKKIANTFVGVQYNAKSWDVRFLWEDSAYTNVDPNDPATLSPLTSTYILQFELKGIGGAGESDNLASRLNQINGYQEKSWGV